MQVSLCSRVASCAVEYELGADAATECKPSAIHDLWPISLTFTVLDRSASRLLVGVYDGSWYSFKSSISLPLFSSLTLFPIAQFVPLLSVYFYLLLSSTTFSFFLRYFVDDSSTLMFCVWFDLLF